MLWCGYDDGRVSSMFIEVSLCLLNFYVLKSLCFPMMLLLCYALNGKELWNVSMGMKYVYVSLSMLNV